MSLVRADDGVPLSRKCALAGVSRASLYYEPRPADARTLALQLVVDKLYMEFPYYGTRRVMLHLRREGHAVGRDKARSLMAAVGWRTIHPGPRPTKPQPGHRIYPYLLRDMDVIRPGEVWCADITYIPVRGGFFYLVAVMDWASRFVLSWELDNTMEVGFCVSAMEEALRSHDAPSISNTDQGSQFTSEAFVRPLLDAGVRIRPSPPAGRLPTGWESRIGLDPIRRGGIEARLGGGGLQPVPLSKLHVEPHLVIRYVSPRHGLRPLVKTKAP